MRLHDIRGKQANINRWNVLKTLDWEKDQEIIKRIFNVSNPLFFTKRTTDEIIEYFKEEIRIDQLMKKADQE